MTSKSVKVLTEDRDYWKNLCSELSDKNFELEAENEERHAVNVDLTAENKRLQAELKESQRINSVMDGNLVRCGREIIDKENEQAELQYQIDQLQEALGFYADNKNYEVNVIDQWEPKVQTMIDSGDKARQALVGETNGQSKG